MKISLVVPLFNEEQTVRAFYRAIRHEPLLREHAVEIVFINDGSTDRTAEHAQALAMADSDVMLINFSRNFGKEAALFAGLEYATGDAVVPMDVDLQPTPASCAGSCDGEAVSTVTGAVCEMNTRVRLRSRSGNVSS